MEPVPSPEKFDVILADPPWKYNSRANHKTRFRGGACGHYDLMSTEEICAIPVQDWAAPGAVLFLWACYPMLIDAFKVTVAWGFEYKTMGFTWVKTNPGNGKPFFGVGYYTKSNAEPCLLATRGGVIKPHVNTVSQVIVAPRTKHSEKPAEVMDRIDLMYPYARKLELFARRERPGWTGWGGELGFHLSAAGVEVVPLPERPRACPGQETLF